MFGAAGERCGLRGCCARPVSGKAGTTQPRRWQPPAMYLSCARGVQMELWGADLSGPGEMGTVGHQQSRLRPGVPLTAGTQSRDSY